MIISHFYLLIISFIPFTNALVNVYNCTIDSNLDIAEGDYTNCEVGATPGKCTYRSAIAYCNEHMIDGIPHGCNIYFPNGQTIILNETYGELTIWRNVGLLALIGNGCTVTSSNYSGIRFLNLYDPVSAVGTLALHISDMTISHFGNGTVFGGAIRMYDTEGSVFQNVTFSNNRAGIGGALYMSRNRNVTFEDVSFLNNIGIGDAGGLMLNAINNYVLFQRCLFSGNEAQGNNDDENPGRGGALFLDSRNDDVIVKNCVFEYNQALRGASVCTNDENLRFRSSGTTFQHNIAFLHSGGIYSIYDNTDMTLVNSTFFNNTASDGAGVGIFRYFNILTCILTSKRCVLCHQDTSVVWKRWFQCSRLLLSR